VKLIIHIFNLSPHHIGSQVVPFYKEQQKARRLFLYTILAFVGGIESFKEIKLEVNNLCENLPLDVQNASRKP